MRAKKGKVIHNPHLCLAMPLPYPQPEWPHLFHARWNVPYKKPSRSLERDGFCCTVPPGTGAFLRDRVDLDYRLQLTVAVQLVHALLGLVPDGGDFVCLGFVVDDRGPDGNTAD